MKTLLAAILGLLTLSNFLALLFDQEIECEECIEDLVKDV